MILGNRIAKRMNPKIVTNSLTVGSLTTETTQPSKSPKGDDIQPMTNDKAFWNKGYLGFRYVYD